MAWTTSAGLRARQSGASIARAWRRKAARSPVAAFPTRLPTGGCPVLIVSLAILALGLATPLLPASLVTASLLITGILLAVLGTGANLAGTLAAMREPAQTDRRAEAAALAQHVRNLIPARSINRSEKQKLPESHDWAALMARIHHELRTPLNAVIGFSEVMALEMFGPLGNERYQNYARYIHESAGDLLKSAEDTLALTALLTTPRKPEPPTATTLEHAIADAWKFLERKASPRNIGLEMVVPPEIQVLCEPRALRQVLVNMLSEGMTRAESGSFISVLAVADAELIEVVLSVHGETSAEPRTGSLAICLARSLLEMQGTSLLEIETAGNGWSAVTVFDRAVQPDFFSGLLHHHGQRYQQQQLAAV